MPTSINYPPDARGKYSLPALFALTGIAVLSFLVYIPPTKGELLDKLTSRLREEKFEQLYEEADDSVRLNVTKERFVRRMKAAARKLKAIDPDLNFRRDASLEQLFQRNDAYMISTAKRLEGNGKAVAVLIYWTPEGEFSDMTANPESGTPKEFHVRGISYKSLTVGGRIVED